MKQIKIKDIIFIIALLSATYLAVIDNNFRTVYGQILAGISGGYFGLSLPDKD